MLRASVANFGGDIESTAWRGGEGERFSDKGEVAVLRRTWTE